MKLRRLKLDDVRANYKPLSKKQQAEIVGGFTQSEFLYMKNNGAWQGGEVDGMGYVTREGNVSLDGIIVYGYPNDGRFHVGESIFCERCYMMNPDIRKPWNNHTNPEGVFGNNVSTSLYHWFDKKY